MRRRDIWRDTALLACLAALAVVSLAGLATDAVWFLDLFNHFRPQWVVAALGLAAAAAWCRRPRVAAAALVLALVNGAVVAEALHAFNRHTGEEAGTGPGVRVVMANLWYKNTDRASIGGLLEREGADIFVALEVDAGWDRALANIEHAYPYALKHPMAGRFGVSVYSKLPFDGKLDLTGLYEMPLLYLDFRRFVLVAGHPVPPLRHWNYLVTRDFIREVARIADASAKPVVVAGDFNATLWSHNIRPFRDGGYYPGGRMGLFRTWRTDLPPLGLQIDHFFLKNLASQGFRVLPDIGSDHFPVAITLRPPSGDGAGQP